MFVFLPIVLERIVRVDEAEKDRVGGWILSVGVPAGVSLGVSIGVSLGVSVGVSLGVSVGVRRFPQTGKALGGASGALKQAGSASSRGSNKERISSEWTDELWEALPWVWVGLTQSRKAPCFGLEGSVLVVLQRAS